MKYRLPEGCGDRREAIELLLNEERELSRLEMNAVREAVKKILFEAKGYVSAEIEMDCEFDVRTGSEPAKSKVDFVVCISGRRFVSIKCAVDALVSRQRHALACARLLDPCQVPFAVITDGVDAIVLDTVTGEVIGEGLDAVPSRESLLETIGRAEFIALPEEKAEKEKRIVSAFDATGC
ncbi:MAG: hypothetical protein C4538_10640 [Nitrospiraceae bacterium]|nr:MAG: hypothetical protein C4538_10640 [Nitrospiraceae bacterium]